MAMFFVIAMHADLVEHVVDKGAARIPNGAPAAEVGVLLLGQAALRAVAASMSAGGSVLTQY